MAFAAALGYLPVLKLPFLSCRADTDDCTSLASEACCAFCRCTFDKRRCSSRAPWCARRPNVPTTSMHCTFRCQRHLDAVSDCAIDCRRRLLQSGESLLSFLPKAG